MKGVLIPATNLSEMISTNLGLESYVGQDLDRYFYARLTDGTQTRGTRTCRSTRPVILNLFR